MKLYKTLELLNFYDTVEIRTITHENSKTIYKGAICSIEDKLSEYMRNKVIRKYKEEEMVFGSKLSRSELSGMCYLEPIGRSYEYYIIEIKE